MIIHLMRIKVKPRYRNDAVLTIRSSLWPTQAQRGCLECTLYSQIDNDDGLLLIEKWESWKLFKNHIESERFRLLLETIELGKEEPSVEIHTVTSTKGLDDITNITLKSPK